MTTDLFTCTPTARTQPYPHNPRYKDESTSKEAAEATKPKANIVREMVRVAFLKHKTMTASECSAYLNLPEDTVSPRLSELCSDKQGRLLTKTTQRKPRTFCRASEAYYALNLSNT